MEKRFFKNIEIKYREKSERSGDITSYMREREMIKKNNLLRELVKTGLTFKELDTENNKKLKFIKTQGKNETISSSMVFILGILLTLGFFNLTV